MTQNAMLDLIEQDRIRVRRREWVDRLLLLLLVGVDLLVWATITALTLYVLRGPS